MANELKIVNKQDSAEIWIYEDIGEGFFGGLSAKYFADQLNGIGNVKHLDVRINSAGGSVMDGVAIYNSLVKHPASVDVHIDGWALSIASIIAMAGDTVTMPENGLFMIHDPMGFVGGNAAAMRDTAELLDKVKTTLINTYQTKADLSDKQLSDMMAAETWLTAQEAKDYGFVTELGAEMQMAAHFNAKTIGMFKQAPEEFDRQVKSYAKPNKESFAVKRAKILTSLKKRKL